MMNKFKKFASVATAFAALLSCGACKLPASGEKGVLKISSFYGGYGDTWAQKLAEGYRSYNPSVQVKVVCNTLVRDEAVTAAQTNQTDTDIYFIDGIGVGQYCEAYGSFADLSEVYSSTPKTGEKTEEKTIAEKIRSEIVSEMQYGGDQEAFKDKYYTVPSPSGPCSLILNEDALNNALGAGQWEEPRTTDELFALCERIKNANATVSVAGVSYTVYPFIYSGGAVEYWRYLYNPWIAQYDGVEKWGDFAACKKDGVYAKEAYQTEGKAKAYAQFERLVKRANGYCDPSSMNNKYTASQKYFFQGRACMYVCGDWLEREMENATEYKANLRMIRTPVISDLAEKIEQTYHVSLGSDAAEKDKTLSAAVKAADEKQNAFAKLASDAYEEVKSARAVTFTLANSAVGFVPACSVNIDLAIDFFRYMYSDEGVKIVLNASKSYLPVINANEISADGEISGFRVSVNGISGGNTKYIYSSSKDPIRYRAGLDLYMGNEKPEVAMGKKTGAMSAAEYLQREMRLLDEKWSDYMYSIG